MESRSLSIPGIAVAALAAVAWTAGTGSDPSVSVVATGPWTAERFTIGSVIFACVAEQEDLADVCPNRLLLKEIFKISCMYSLSLLRRTLSRPVQSSDLPRGIELSLGGIRGAKKKAAGSSTNGRDSAGRRLVREQLRYATFDSPQL